MSTRRFAHSFHIIGKPPKGKHCDKLKYHYSGALRELVGILELIAENDPDRFVFANVPSLIEHCHRYKQPANKFGERWLRQCLAELRARSIISKRLRHLADRQLGMREGFYLMPHDAVCVERGGLCVFQQGIDPSRCPEWWAHQSEWAWPHLQIVESAPHSAPQNAGASAPRSAPHSAPHSAGASAPHSAPLPSRHVDESEKVKPENRSLTVLTAVPVQTEQTDRAESSRIKTAAGQGLGAVSSVNACKPLNQWRQKLREFETDEGDGLDPALLYSEPFPSDLPTLLALLEKDDYFLDKAHAWATMRQPWLKEMTIKNRWVLCLEECFGIQPTRP